MAKTNSSIIRKATVEDAAALRALRLEALQNKPEAFGSDHEKESKETVLDWEERLTEQTDNTIFVAVVDSTLVGMTGIGKYHHTRMKHNGYIWGVYVQPAWRGQGISEQLMEACIRWAKERSLRLVKLGVITTNPAAINSYIRVGFRVYGVEPQVIYYDGVYYDELLMVKEL
jgi:ribosomal protein S18 acetylase RimI-like enzyme